MPDLRIGISGWTYPPWRGVFYPEGLPQKRELEFASRQLNTIEINGSFYSLQRPESFFAWREAVPDDFVFSVKGGRYITHMKKLRDVEEPLANFFASGVLALGDKLGPFLWQLPPNLGFDRERLEGFLRLLPRDLRSARALGRKRSDWMTDRSWLGTHGNRELRHALEVRHPSFDDPEFFSILRDQGVALVVSHSSGVWPCFEEVTADFVYVRLHGHGELYAGGYEGTELDKWAARVRAWRRRKRDVYVYFDNDAKVRAPFDAMALAEKFGIRRAGGDLRAAA